ncbi:hypothetical protein GSI_03620 [Ganoderma sinense ZZ0214-1]|uniref:Uncharacterized protein n=1 Tax=Ganoderma sinense ZZ0214-1 TaxID=1077348 RepID=A0A2G8SJG0_9APHY|nr:hypothetical protein GSI_03620 [Ganoderma sinense ZZ0214-1]
MRRIGKIGKESARSSRLPMLALLKASLEILSACGSSAPFLQGVVDAALKVIQYAEDAKQNKTDAQELALSAAEIVQALSDATEGLSEDALAMDPRFELDLARFHGDLSAIVETMKRLADTNVWLRLVQKDRHSAEISRHRLELQQAVMVFQIRDGISRRVLAVRHHEEVMGGLKTLTGLVSRNTPVLSMPPARHDLVNHHRKRRTRDATMGTENSKDAGRKVS